MNEDGQREGEERVGAAVLVSRFPGERHTLFESGGGSGGVAQPQGDPPQSFEDGCNLARIVEFAIERQAFLAQRVCSLKLTLHDG